MLDEPESFLCLKYYNVCPCIRTLMRAYIQKHVNTLWKHTWNAVSAHIT